MPSQATADEKHFSIVVKGKEIWVDGILVSAKSAAATAKRDGRPVRITWQRALTSAESELKRALQAEKLSYDEITSE